MGEGFLTQIGQQGIDLHFPQVLAKAEEDDDILLTGISAFFFFVGRNPLDFDFMAQHSVGKGHPLSLSDTSIDQRLNFFFDSPLSGPSGKGEEAEGLSFPEVDGLRIVLSEGLPEPLKEENPSGTPNELVFVYNFTNFVNDVLHDSSRPLPGLS